jgi:dCTP deaminase
MIPQFSTPLRRIGNVRKVARRETPFGDSPHWIAIMILSGSEILRASKSGQICIDPFSEADLNPNSYNYHLGPTLIHLPGKDAGKPRQMEIPFDGLILSPGHLYLGTTRERIGSTTYAVTLLGRSSTGRLGIFVTATADLGHVGSLSNWTLEISVVQPVRVYAAMRIGQVAFWAVHGLRTQYAGRYLGDTKPETSKDSSLNLTLKSGSSA